MASGPPEKGRAIQLSTELFLHIEIVVYVALGVLLSLSALLTLGSAALLLLEGMRDWGASTGGEMLFRSSIVELAVLGALILIFVVSIYLLRRGARADSSECPPS
jgi:hypothetical protein